ncbi:hypothetical protein [Nocardia sp. CY41]|uniref:hypothetical protein n=1 Tax=Nocardia sp. CY41 TaxID=2608686 RepID=UPI00135807E4|nr:hypothetical protein [Nocardia sp. CY41]
MVSKDPVSEEWQAIENAQNLMDRTVAQLGELVALAENLDVPERANGTNPIVVQMNAVCHVGLLLAPSIQEAIDAARKNRTAKAGELPGKSSPCVVRHRSDGSPPPI